jgi:hypothetical protein
MDRAFTLASRFTSKNVNKVHRITLKSNWKVDGRLERGATDGMEITATRLFHCPTGISESQELCFCFEPATHDTIFSLNGIQLSLTIIEGLATVPITVMMEAINRVEIRWRGEALETPRVPEYFAAWLEILDNT